jgi:hypothetical protein
VRGAHGGPLAARSRRTRSSDEPPDLA